LLSDWDMRFSVAILAALLLLSWGTPVGAFEPGTDDARAGLCNSFAGVAFTFCVALCEARECDRQPVGDDRCMALSRGFERATDGAVPPCVRTARKKLDLL
jgi:hypothetical protein